MKTPQNLRYTKNHGWISLDGSIAYVGITHYGEKELGGIEKVEVASVGSSLGKHESYGNIIGSKKSSVLFIPIEAEVLHFNEQLTSNPHIINSDPYDKGWIIKIEPLDKNQFNTLMNADEYDEFIKNL